MQKLRGLQKKFAEKSTIAQNSKMQRKQRNQKCKEYKE